MEWEESNNTPNGNSSSSNAVRFDSLGNILDSSGVNNKNRLLPAYFRKKNFDYNSFSISSNKLG